MRPSNLEQYLVMAPPFLPNETRAARLNGKRPGPADRFADCKPYLATLKTENSYFSPVAALCNFTSTLFSSLS